jgi:hypothetical protein
MHSAPIHSTKPPSAAEEIAKLTVELEQSRHGVRRFSDSLSWVRAARAHLPEEDRDFFD